MSSHSESSATVRLAEDFEWKETFNQLRMLSVKVEMSRPGCSKLTMSLVNVSLKFQTLISQIHQFFLLKKREKLLHCKSFSHFFNQNISVFGYRVVKHLTS